MFSKLAVAMTVFALAVTPAFAQVDFSFGDDSGEYANDGECDDPRFEGSGMTTTPLLSDDVLHDAQDCKAAFDAGDLTLRGVTAKGKIDFGDDEGEYSLDGECDDLRFIGAGMTTTELIEDDIMHDASDCRDAYNAKTITLHLE